MSSNVDHQIPTEDTVFTYKSASSEESPFFSFRVLRQWSPASEGTWGTPVSTTKNQKSICVRLKSLLKCPCAREFPTKSPSVVGNPTRGLP